MVVRLAGTGPLRDEHLRPEGRGGARVLSEAASCLVARCMEKARKTSALIIPSYTLQRGAHPRLYQGTEKGPKKQEYDQHYHG